MLKKFRQKLEICNQTNGYHQNYSDEEGKVEDEEEKMGGEEEGLILTQRVRFNPKELGLIRPSKRVESNPGQLKSDPTHVT